MTATTPVILAIDPSTTRVGWAVLEIDSERLLGSGSYAPPVKRNTLVRLWAACRAVEDGYRAVATGHPAFVAVERPFHHHKGGGYSGVLEIGAAWGALATCGLSIGLGHFEGDRERARATKDLDERLIVLDNQRVKACVTGSGHAQKETVRAAVEARFGRRFDRYDESDAVAIALTALDFVRWQQKVREQGVSASGHQLDPRTQALLKACSGRGARRRRARGCS